MRGNAELLAHVRATNPGAHIIYRPHPDVVAGHRPGHVAQAMLARHADQVVEGGPIAPLLCAVDEVHTMTSLAGYEALLRGRRVHTYGQPFYAGWGLTIDHGLLPETAARRTRRLELEDLAAATLILYPRYIDPGTGLMCQPETLIARLQDPELWQPTVLMQLRALQGRLHMMLRGVFHPTGQHQ